MPSISPQANFWRSDDHGTLPAPTATVPFAGRIGANQEFSVDKNNCAQIEFLQRIPDASPWIPLRNSLSLKQVLQPELWKAAAVEAIGLSCLLFSIIDTNAHL